MIRNGQRRFIHPSALTIAHPVYFRKWAAAAVSDSCPVRFRKLLAHEGSVSNVQLGSALGSDGETGIVQSSQSVSRGLAASDSLNSLADSSSHTNIVLLTFYQCNSLSELIIPDSVTSIGSHAFYGARELKNVVLSANLTTIEDYYSIPSAFIRNITVPNRGDFYCVGKDNSIALKCFSIEKTVTVPEGIETVVVNFDNNDIVETLIFPGSVKRVVNCISGMDNLKKIVFEEGVEELGSCWLSAVPNLTEVYFPESIKSSVMSVWETMSEKKYGTDFNDALTFYVKKGSYMDEHFKKNDYESRGANIVYY